MRHASKPDTWPDDSNQTVQGAAGEIMGETGHASPFEL